MKIARGGPGLQSHWGAYLLIIRIDYSLQVYAKNCTLNFSLKFNQMNLLHRIDSIMQSMEEHNK